MIGPNHAKWVAQRACAAARRHRSWEHEAEVAGDAPPAVPVAVQRKNLKRQLQRNRASLREELGDDAEEFFVEHGLRGEGALATYGEMLEADVAKHLYIYIYMFACVYDTVYNL